MGPAKMIPALLALSPGSCSRCTCSTTEGTGAAGGIRGEEEEAIMAGRAEDGPFPWSRSLPRTTGGAKREGS